MLSFQQPQQVCCAAEECTCILHVNSKPHQLLIVTRPKGIANDASARPTNLSSASYDLAIWFPYPQSRPFQALAVWTTCANLHQNLFIRFSKYRVYKFCDTRTNKEVENMPPPANFLVGKNAPVSRRLLTFS